MGNELSVKELLEQAIIEVRKLKNNEVFMVKDLFKGYEWNRIELNKRLRLGSLFLNEIESDPQLNVECFDKSSAKQQRYIKISKKGQEGLIIDCPQTS